MFCCSDFTDSRAQVASNCLHYQQATRRGRPRKKFKLRSCIQWFRGFQLHIRNSTNCTLVSFTSTDQLATVNLKVVVCNQHTRFLKLPGIRQRLSLPSKQYASTQHPPSTFFTWAYSVLDTQQLAIMINIDTVNMVQTLTLKIFFENQLSLHFLLILVLSSLAILSTLS